MPNVLAVIASFLSNTCMGKCSGISFIDSTILKVCDNRRIHSHKVFKNNCTTREIKHRLVLRL
uniref:Transposase DDE domain protein n=1 Tax=Leptospira santarosai serovar Arenal str. MAVJ 401 TaxID=1049976 RepID=M6K0K3_9LEPT|nr:transposase DDE domain protein [Leptospira santarosai serovar Arenal str. MAVJ 401]